MIEKRKTTRLNKVVNKYTQQHLFFALLFYMFVVATTLSFCRRQRRATLVAWVTYFFFR
jgi:hypothetical protein